MINVNFLLSVFLFSPYFLFHVFHETGISILILIIMIVFIAAQPIQQQYKVGILYYTITHSQVHPNNIP